MKHARVVTSVFVLALGCKEKTEVVPAQRSAATPSIPAGDGEALINGAKLAYHVRGKGPIAVVVPGGPGWSWNYLKMPALEERLTLVYLEPVGTGASARLADAEAYTRQRYVDDLEKFRAHLGLERMMLIGHSFGGVVAELYAVKHPDRLAGLVLYATVPRFGDEWLEDVGANLRSFEKQPWYAAALDALEKLEDSKNDQELDAGIRLAIPFYVGDYEAHKAEVDKAVADVHLTLFPLKGPKDQAPFDVRAELGSIRAPTLVISTERDFVCSKRFGEQIHRGIPGSKMIVLPGVGHIAHWEQPEAVAKPIADFVIGLSSGS